MWRPMTVHLCFGLTTELADTLIFVFRRATLMKAEREKGKTAYLTLEKKKERKCCTNLLNHGPKSKRSESKQLHHLRLKMNHNVKD